MPPHFSICIPNYNYGHFLGATLRSVLAQTYPHFDVIVADNASTDDSLAVIAAHATDRVRVIRNHFNVGFAHNLDRATREACGDFVIVLSADDLMLPDALATYAEHIRACAEYADPHRLVMYAGCLVIDAEGQVIGVRHAKPDVVAVATGVQSVVSGHTVLRAVLRTLTAPGTFCTMAYARALYAQVEGYASCHSVAPDAFFGHKIMGCDPTVIYVDQLLFAYRIHGDNQQAQQDKHAAITLAIDRYLYTLAYTPEWLAQIGLAPDAVVRAFVDETCVRVAMWELLRGERAAWARKVFVFGWATYPRVMLRHWRSWMMAVLVILGPITPVVGRILRRLHRKMRRKPRPSSLGPHH